jgi:hypothetical protein
MHNQRVIGIGCYAKPEKLASVLKKMVHHYTLGQFEGLERMNAKEAGSSDGIKLLKALMAGQTGCFQLQSQESDSSSLENKKIIGFFLALKGQRLNLSVFTKGERSKQERYTACLDEFTKLRQKRLN